jgi:hypothetical protein
VSLKAISNESAAQQRVRRILGERLDAALKATRLAERTFMDLIARTPTGIPAPDSGLYIHQARAEWKRSLDEYRAAETRWLDFLMHGIVPVDFEDPENQENLPPSR